MKTWVELFLQFFKFQFPGPPVNTYLANEALNRSAKAAASGDNSNIGKTTL